MKYVLGMLSAALLCAGAPIASAQNVQRLEENTSPQHPVMTGSGLVCDTKEQAARFVSLMGDDDVEETLLAVNREAGDAQACVVATIGFIPGSKVAEVDKNGTIVDVIEVQVVAIATNVGLQPVEPKTYYSVVTSRQRSV